MAATKRQIYTDQFRGLGDSVSDAATRLDVMMGQPDFAEGVAALTEKRPPRFS